MMIRFLALAILSLIPCVLSMPVDTIGKTEYAQMSYLTFRPIIAGSGSDGGYGSDGVNGGNDGFGGNGGFGGSGGTAVPAPEPQGEPGAPYGICCYECSQCSGETTLKNGEEDFMMMCNGRKTSTGKCCMACTRDDIIGNVGNGGTGGDGFIFQG